MDRRIFMTAAGAGVLGAGMKTNARNSGKGAIVFCLYTVNRGVLKLTAQIRPWRAFTAGSAALEVDAGGGFKKIASSCVVIPGFTAHFRVDGWDAARDYEYRVRTADGSAYGGTIRKDPAGKEELTVAAFTGNGPRPHVPKNDIVENLKKIDPDLLVFTGDQVYRHYGHLRKWIEFGEDFRELIKDRPTICLPDDHDVGQPNLWGEAGKRAFTEYEGGYLRSPLYVNQVQRAQTWHLPDPTDPTPVQQGITVYYTSLTWGGVSFAIIEDRKWKSGCLGLVTPELGPRPDHVTVKDYDFDHLDPPGKKLLGKRQEEFLERWTNDWEGAEMKAVISQTQFSGLANRHGPAQKLIRADLDCNGWPRTPRDRALKIIRRSFSFMINGDQHLGAVIHQGTDDWEDAGFSFCVPSIANYYARSFIPESAPVKPWPGGPEHSGSYLDGLGNKITLAALANPKKTGRQPSALHDQAPGYGIVRFNKKKRTIKMECWPRQVDPAKPENVGMQYPGWPLTIAQEDNYRPAPENILRLPTINLSGARDPVVKVVREENNELIYAIRIKGESFEPWVTEPGPYKLKVMADGEAKAVIFNGLEPLSGTDPGNLEAVFK